MKKIMCLLCGLFFIMTVEAVSIQCKPALQNKIVLIVSQHCPQCKKALPVIEQVIENKNLEKNFQLLNINNQIDRNYIKDNNINLRFVPTLIVNCQYHVGVFSKAEYEKIINLKEGANNEKP